MGLIRWLIRQRHLLPPTLVGERQEARLHNTAAGAKSCGEHTEWRTCCGSASGALLCHPASSQHPTPTVRSSSLLQAKGWELGRSPRPPPRPARNLGKKRPLSLSFSTGFFSVFSLAYGILLAVVFWVDMLYETEEVSFYFQYTENFYHVWLLGFLH